MVLKKSYLELFQFESVGSAYIANVAAKSETSNQIKIEDKLCVQIKNVFKQIVKIRETYNEEVDRLQTNNCMTYPEGHKFHKAIMYEEVKMPDGTMGRQKQFNPEGELKLKKELKVLLDEKVDIHSRIPEGVEEFIKDLSDYEKEVFSGLVIPEIEKEDETTK